MPLTKLTGFQKKVADLNDVPVMSSAELKNYFDSSPEEVRNTLNAVIDVLLSTSADSGAKNVGVNAISGLTAANVQEAIAALKTLADSKTSNTGNHAGTWAGYTPANFPLDVTRDQMFIFDQVLDGGHSGDRYPTGLTLMNVSNAAYFPATSGLVVTFKYNSLRFTQHFYKNGSASTEVGMWFRHWYNGAWTAWQQVATITTVNDSISSVVKGSKIQSGTITVTIPGQSNVSKTLSFPESFSKAPAVVATVQNSNQPELFGDCGFTSVSSSSALFTARNNAANSYSMTYSWIAMA